MGMARILTTGLCMINLFLKIFKNGHYFMYFWFIIKVYNWVNGEIGLNCLIKNKKILSGGGGQSKSIVMA